MPTRAANDKLSVNQGTPEDGKPEKRIDFSKMLSLGGLALFLTVLFLGWYAWTQWLPQIQMVVQTENEALEKAREDIHNVGHTDVRRLLKQACHNQNKEACQLLKNWYDLGGSVIIEGEEVVELIETINSGGVFLQISTDEKLSRTGLSQETLETLQGLELETIDDLRIFIQENEFNFNSWTVELSRSGNMDMSREVIEMMQRAGYGIFLDNWPNSLRAAGM